MSNERKLQLTIVGPTGSGKSLVLDAISEHLEQLGAVVRGAGEGICAQSVLIMFEQPELLRAISKQHNVYSELGSVRRDLSAANDALSKNLDALGEMVAERDKALAEAKSLSGQLRAAKRVNDELSELIGKSGDVLASQYAMPETTKALIRMCVARDKEVAESREAYVKLKKDRDTQASQRDEYWDKVGEVLARNEQLERQVEALKELTHLVDHTAVKIGRFDTKHQSIVFEGNGVTFDEMSEGVYVLRPKTVEIMNTEKPFVVEPLYNTEATAAYEMCDVPQPKGFHCIRKIGHSGPCAAVEGAPGDGQ